MLCAFGCYALCVYAEGVSEKLDGAKIFDVKFLVILSLIVILLSPGVTVTYGFPIMRYFLMGAGLIGGIVVAALKRKAR